MHKFTIQNFGQSALYALTASLTIASMLFVGFFFAEPSITHGQVDSSTFTIRQQIVDETSFLVNPTNVTMSGSINGVTGGNATGSTQFSVISNNATGYYVEISFFNNATPQTMLGDVTASEAIRDYTASSTEPGYGYTASTAAQFAYTVNSDNTGDTDDSFLNSGGLCNQPAGSGNGATKVTKCWMEPTVSAFRIVDRNTSAITGATSTVEFDITVPSGATPVPSAETYTATATLSLFTQ